MGLACVKGHNPELESGVATLFPQQAPEESPAIIAAAESDPEPNAKSPDNVAATIVSLHVSLHAKALSPDHIVLDNFPNNIDASRAEHGDEPAVEAQVSTNSSQDPELLSKCDANCNSSSSDATEVKPVVDIVKDISEMTSAASHDLVQCNNQQLEGVASVEQSCPAPTFNSSVHGEVLESTFEEFPTQNRESDVEVSSPEGIIHVASEMEINKVDAGLAPGISNVLEGLAIDLTESMKMRTVRSSSKKHKKAKNRRRRLRAQQFANGASS